jgi:transcriptional regulator NrdR family protein
MSGRTVDVVKRGGKRPTETFNLGKLRSSIHAACLSVRSPESQADEVANLVCDTVIVWLGDKNEITSEDLRRKASETLQIHHPDAAYLYKHHRLIV